MPAMLVAYLVCGATISLLLSLAWHNRRQGWHRPAPDQGRVDLNQILELYDLVRDTEASPRIAIRPFETRVRAVDEIDAWSFLSLQRALGSSSVKSEGAKPAPAVTASAALR